MRERWMSGWMDGVGIKDTPEEYTPEDASKIGK